MTGDEAMLRQDLNMAYAAIAQLHNMVEDLKQRVLFLEGNHE